MIGLPYFPIIGASGNESMFVVKSTKRIGMIAYRVNENQRVLSEPNLDFERLKSFPVSTTINLFIKSQAKYCPHREPDFFFPRYLG
jgi:hypothetical protein